LQSRTANQQSFVRTDFTLKYLHLEDELKKSAFFKVIGSQSAVFIRSWIDYIIHKDVLVLPWAHGDLRQIQLDYCTKNELDVTKPTEFSKFIAQLKGAVVIAVDFMAVDTAAFSTLIKQIKKYNERLENVEAMQHKAAEGLNQISVVIFFQNESDLSENQKSALVEFKASLFIGELNISTVKARTSSGTNKLLVSAIVGGMCAVVWLNQQTIANFINSKPAQQVQSNDVKVDSSLANNTESTALVNIEPAKQATVLLEINDDGLIDRTEPVDNMDSAIEVDNGDKNSQLEASSIAYTKGNVGDDPIDNTAQSLQVVSQEVLVSSEAPSSENIAQSNNLNENGESQSIASITDDTPNIHSAPVTDEQKITILIDRWMDGWQQRNFSEYSESYSGTYSAKKSMSHKQWLDWRQKRIEKPKWIKLSRSDIAFAVHDSKTEAYRITFTLNYSSPNYKDKTLKRLDVESIDGHFKIVAEENIKVTRLK